MIRSKLPSIGTSIFSVMTDLASQHNAVNLSQGFPDFSVSDKLINLVTTYMKNGYNQYAPMPGIIELREKIAEKFFNLYNYNYNPDTEITITSGATQAIYATISALVQEGDEVIIIEPAYDSYVPAVRMAGATPVFIQMKYPEFKIEWNDLNRAINSRTKLIIINTPHNPSGSVLSTEDMEKLQKTISSSKIMVLSDEVYEHIVFDGYEHQSVARFPHLAERSIIVGSFGKLFHATGWKTGYCLAPAEMMKEIRKIHQFMVFCVNTPIQYALAEFLKNSDTFLHLPAIFQERRNYFGHLLNNSLYKLTPSAGTYFQIIDYSAISDEQDVDFAIRLVKDFGVAAIPLSVFYREKPKVNLLRVCFAKSNETLNAGVAQLLKAQEKLKA